MYEWVYDFVMIIWRLALAITVLPFGLDEWINFVERIKRK